MLLIKMSRSATCRMLFRQVVRRTTNNRQYSCLLKNALLLNTSKTACTVRSSASTNQLLSSRTIYLSSNPLYVKVEESVEQAIVRNDNHLKLEIEGQMVNINYLWLRDHCRCQECYNHTTNQRTYGSHHWPLDIQPKECYYEGDNLVLIWPDGHRTEYIKQWLLTHSHPRGQDRLRFSTLYWNNETIKKAAPERVMFNDHMNTDEGLKTSLSNLTKYGFTFVTNTPPTLDGTEQVARRLCHIQETMYGGMWTLVANQEKADTAYSTVHIGAHTDNTYFCATSGIQIFHCVAHDGTGGESLMVDGFHAAEKVRHDDPDSFNFLTRTIVPHEYIGDGHHMMNLCTVLHCNPITKELAHIRYNPYDRAPLDTISSEDIPQFYKAWSLLASHIEAPANEYWVKLTPGTVLLFNNWRVLHGRSGFTGNRVIMGCYLPHDDWMSRARTMLTPN